MLKTLFAILALCFSLNAQAVDVTITLTAAQANRAAAACGVALNLKDAQAPPQPRACTMAEAKVFIIGLLRQVVVDVEGRAAEVLRGPVVVPAFDPT